MLSAQDVDHKEGYESKIKGWQPNHSAAQLVIEHEACMNRNLRIRMKIGDASLCEDQTTKEFEKDDLLESRDSADKQRPGAVHQCLF